MSARKEGNEAAGTRTPPSRGHLWYDDEISERFFRGRVSTRWVREHLPRGKGLKIGRDWAWYELDILEWMDAQRGAGRRIPEGRDDVSIANR